MTREATPERVIIAGGGPAGMSAALFLVAAGVPVLLLERGSRPHDDPRAATYHPPTLEMGGTGSSPSSTSRRSGATPTTPTACNASNTSWWR